MMFWIVTAAMAVIAAAILILATARRRSYSEPVAAYDLKVYRDQLAEVERDLARGVVDEADAERVRTEIARRILAADAASNSMSGADPVKASSAHPVVWVLVVLIVLGGSGYTYWQLGAPGYGDLALADRIEAAEALRQARPSQATAEASIADADLPPFPQGNEEYADLVQRLRGVIAERPNDAEGHRLLAVSERNLGNFAEARAAYDRYVTLQGDKATPAEFADLADMMVLAAGGYVSPEAESALSIALRGDPGNGPARYYWGLMMAQTGRPDQAFRIWDSLLRQGPADAPWIAAIQEQIDDMALRAGVNYAQPTPGPGRGPTAEDIEAAGEMSASERLEMIEGMVAGLSGRLSSEGGTYQEWGQLISALGVLGRYEDALSIYNNALEVFAENKTAIDHINRAGQRAGVAE